jgi:hypothetical protein
MRRRKILWPRLLKVGFWKKMRGESWPMIDSSSYISDICVELRKNNNMLINISKVFRNF